MMDETTVIIDHDTESQAPVPEATTRSADERFLAAVEALLFAAHEPLPASTLCAANGHAVWSLDQVIDEINERMASGGHPMRVRKVAGGYQMRTLPEFAPYLGRCRFTDCAHVAEPGCAVRQAAEDGRVARRRYESYLKLREELIQEREFARFRARGRL